MAVEPVFVDTNVLVYATRPSASHHAAARAALSHFEAEGAVLWISPQVLRKYLAVVTRPQATAAALPMSIAIADVVDFRATFEVVEERPEGLDRLLVLLAVGGIGGRQVHDANIVASMLSCGIRRLVTFNATDFRAFAGEVEILSLP